MSEDIDKNLNQIKELFSGGNSSENLKSVFSSLLNQSGSSDSSANFEEKSQKTSAPFDAETLQMFLKIKQVLDGSRKNNDPREKLLEALRPYLNDKRKDKLQDCIKILKMINLIDIFSKMEGSDKHGDSTNS